MKNKLPAAILLLALAFLIITYLVQKDVLAPLDLRTTIYIQRVFPRFFDLSLSLFSLVGTIEIVSIVFLILLYFSKNLNKLLMLSLYTLTAVIELIGKATISQTAPPIAFLRTYHFFDVPSGVVSGYFFSYPSGHSARTAFISAFLIYLVWENKKLNRQTKQIISFGVILFDLVMLFSRVYLGEHWLTDVVAGAILGFLLFLTGVTLSRRLATG